MQTTKITPGSDLFANLKSSLEHYYEMKFPAEKHKKSQFADLIISILIKINQLHKDKPLNLVTMSYNLKDGIGDFVNQADFTAWLIEAFKPFENISVQSVSVLEKEKFGLAKRVMPESVKAKGVETATSRDELDQLEASAELSNLLLGYEVAATQIDHQVISEMMGNADLVVNLARYFLFHPELMNLLAQVKPETMVQSRGEYGLPSKPYAPETFEEKLYVETAMGVTADSTGVKFYESIHALCQTHITDQEKGELFAEFENKKLQQAVLGKDNPADFMKKHGFAFGYIQEKERSILFARLMLAKAAKKPGGVAMVVALPHFENISKDKLFMQQLKDSGYTKIRFIKNDGTVGDAIPVQGGDNNNVDSGKEDEDKEKVLTLIDFRGTSQADKERMIAMSDMVAGSGNSSFSEMLSAQRFPFIQPIFHVKPFYESFIAELDRQNIPDRDLLKRYLALNIKTDLSEKEIQEMLSMVSDEHQVALIMKAWKNYCDFLRTNRDAYHDFIEIISTFIISKGLELDQSLITDLLAFINPETVLSGYTLLHICIEKNLEKLADTLIEKYPNLIDAPCDYKGFTPLMMAARYGRYPLVEMLLSSGADIEKTDSEGLTVFHHAILAKDIRLITLLLKHNKTLLDINNNHSAPLLTYLLKQNANDIPFIQHCLQAAGLSYAVTDVARYAVEFSAPGLFTACCEMGDYQNRSELKKVALEAKEYRAVYLGKYLEVFKKPIENSFFMHKVLSPFMQAYVARIKPHNVDAVEFQLALLKLSEKIEPCLSANRKGVKPDSIKSLLSSILATDPKHQYVYAKTTKQTREAIFKLIWMIYEDQVALFEKGSKDASAIESVKAHLLLNKVNYYLYQYSDSQVKRHNPTMEFLTSLSNTIASSFHRKNQANPESVTVSSDTRKIETGKLMGKLLCCATRAQVLDTLKKHHNPEVLTYLNKKLHLEEAHVTLNL